MKNHYPALLLACLIAGPPATVVRAQVTLSNAATFYIGPGGVVAVPTYVTVGTGATLTNEGQLDFGGNLTNNGTVTAPTDPAAALRAVGTVGAQSIAGTAPLPLQNLTVNNAAGATIVTDVTIAGTLTLTNGLVAVAPSSPLVLLPTAANPSETATSHLVGPVRMAPRLVNEAEFGPFLGLSMPAGPNVGSLTLTRVTGPTAITTVNGNASTAVYWEVATTAADNPSRTLNFSWLSAFDNGRNMAQATPWRSAAPYANWQRAAGPTSNVAGADPRQYAPVAAAEAVAGRFTFSDPSAPLPVELAAFSARRQGPDARLNWATASERNNAYFDVERSRDGLGFERAGRITGQGTAAAPHDYQFVDSKIAQYGAPTLYYRLRQVDKDGTFTYSPVRTVAVESATALLVTAWPNPSTGAGPHIRVEQPFEGPLTARLTDATGRLLAECRTTKRLTEELFGAETRGLTSGVYLLRVTTTGTSQTLRLLRN